VFGTLFWVFGGLDVVFLFVKKPDSITHCVVINTWIGVVPSFGVMVVFCSSVQFQEASDVPVGIERGPLGEVGYWTGERFCVF